MADIQTEKAFQKQDGINSYSTYQLFGEKVPTKKISKKKDNKTVKKEKKNETCKIFQKSWIRFFNSK